MKKSATSPHAVEQATRARAAFRHHLGPTAEAQREQTIGALPVVEWKGHTLYALRCHGEGGRGPHTVNVPEALLWALIDLRYYHCPCHNAPWRTEPRP